MAWHTSTLSWGDVTRKSRDDQCRFAPSWARAAPAKLAAALVAGARVCGALITGLLPLSTISLVSSSQAIPATSEQVGWLQVTGNRIVTASGSAVVLRGVNVEDRSWHWATRPAIDYERRAIPKVTAAPPNGWGANLITIAVSAGPVNRNENAYLAAIDAMVALAKTNGAYTQLVYRNDEPNSAATDQPDQGAEMAMAILAGRYAEQPAVLYGLQAEPRNKTWAELKPRYVSMIDAVRAKNPRALVIVPGADQSRLIRPPSDELIARPNLVYVSNVNTLRAVVEASRLGELIAKHPIMLAESGGDSQLDVSEVTRLLDLAEDAKVSWSMGPFNAFACPCLLSDVATFAVTPYGAAVRRRLQMAAAAPTLAGPAAAISLPFSVVAAPTALSAGGGAQLTATNLEGEAPTVAWSLTHSAQKVVEGTFSESFAWLGPQAAVIKGGQATTVWWDEDAWDARGDTSNNAVASRGAGNHIDIHRSSAASSDGVQANAFALNGDGSPGVGVMHLDFEGLTSARLRNPMRISAERPGVVEFWAPKFVTTGHWWEVAIAPANQVTAGEFTAVPSPEQALDGNQGSGHSPPEDSINTVVIGRNDVPNISGWQGRVSVTRAVGTTRRDSLGPTFPMNPQQPERLFHWRFSYYPDTIEVAVSSDENDEPQPFYTFPVSVPWPEVYVYLLGVAYQADKHPQDQSNQGKVREFPWKDVKVSPVVYQRTLTYPKNVGIVRTPQVTGWVGLDMRDTQRFETARGLLAPNLGPYDKHFSMAFCGDASVYGCANESSPKGLQFDLPPSDATGIARAQLVYDTRGNGKATLALNGTSVGSLPGAATVRAAPPDQWVQRSIELDPRAIKAGANSITVTMAGDVQFDRLQIELDYDSAPTDVGLAGKVTASGYYRAPSTVVGPLCVLVRAVSAADPARVAIATITILATDESAAAGGLAIPFSPAVAELPETEKGLDPSTPPPSSTASPTPLAATSVAVGDSAPQLSVLPLTGTGSSGDPMGVVETAKYVGFGLALAVTVLAATGALWMLQRRFKH